VISVGAVPTAAANSQPELGRARLTAENLGAHYAIQQEDRFLEVLRGVSLDIEEGEFACILGPSGCGKTTFLNIVAGLASSSSGMIRIGDAPIKGPGPDRAMVFQQPSLLPWRTVLGNVVYGLELSGRYRRKREQRNQCARRYIELVGLTGFENSYPAQLSGGMQQRVNLARALATDPAMLLMDEPFGALDALTRESMQFELLRIWQEARKTVLFITHDIVEAVYLADRVFIFSNRPGSVKETVSIELARPRSPEMKRTPEFTGYEDRLWRLIQDEATAGEEVHGG
jgi:NitT/TauT family transport system ATP-binding protein